MDESNPCELSMVKITLGVELGIKCLSELRKNGISFLYEQCGLQSVFKIFEKDLNEALKIMEKERRCLYAF